MKSRAEQLRRQHRRVLAWGFSVAAILHIGAFLLLPGLRTESAGISKLVLEGVPAVGGAMVDVRFGPPEIRRPDGAIVREPSQRTLQVVRLRRLPADCDVQGWATEVGVSGSVRLRVGVDGRAENPEIASSTGSRCADWLLTTLAGDLRYLWLPNERFPAPVELVQPVTLVEVVEV